MIILVPLGGKFLTTKFTIEFLGGKTRHHRLKSMFPPMKPFALALFGFFLIPILSLANDPLLPPTYQAGKEYVLQNTQRTEIAGGVGNQAIDLSLDIVVRCDRAKGREGQRVLNTMVTRLKADMKLGALSMNYNSEEAGSEKTLLGQTFSTILDQEFKIYLNEADEVVEVEGLKDLGNNPLAQQFGPKQLSQMVIPQLNLGIPVAGVNIGETWSNKVDGQFGPGTNLNVDYELKYTGDEVADDPHAIIEYSANLAMQLTGGGDEKDSKMSLKIEDGKMTGSVAINKKQRFPRNGTANITMTMEAPNPQNPSQRIDLPVKQTIEFKTLSVSRTGLLR